ncbi:serine hydrolase domain-containing protein [Dokdonella sp.]|uniref:serine hydrolase domain-containing protein n=1 Tax=Dokdonella sp. TaxID=2291710 RepID=UPI003C5BB2C3
MRIRRSIVLAMLLAAQPAMAADQYDFSKVESRALKAVEEGSSPSLAIAIAKDGKIVYEHAFGFADVEARVPATTHTAYSLASATKPITATALMVLHERKEVSLSAPVESYVTTLRFRDAAGEARQVNLLQLLSHTSGLGTYARIYYGDAIAHASSLDDEFRRYGVLVAPPGRVAEYSNLGYGLIGEIIERQARQPFAEFVDQAVFRPLEMKDSFVDDPSGRAISVAVRYDAESTRLPTLRNNTPGAGNAFASVHDLVRFGMFHLDPGSVAHPPLNREDVLRMQVNADPRAFQHYYGAAYYGLGWYVRPDDGGHRVVWHEGGMPGASTIIKMLPEQGIVAVVLSNRTDANNLSQAIADLMIAAVVPDYQSAPLDPVASYVPYAGQPEFLGRWVGTITVDGVKLSCTLELDSEGNGTIRYADPAKLKATTEANLRAMVNGDSFISGFPGRLPTRGIGANDAPLLLLKLVHTHNRLSGAIVAYSSPQRLDYLLPFAIDLVRMAK